MERLSDESEVHFKDKATAMRKAPRLCAVVGTNFSMDKSGRFDILPLKPHRRSCMNSSRFRLSQPRGLKLAPATN